MTSPGLAVGVLLTAYVLVMGYLAAGLWILPADRRHPDGQAIDRTEGAERGWRGFARRVVGTALGGYLLLMIVVVGYYYGVARLGGHFVASAFTGCAALLAVALLTFFLASWLTTRRRRRG